MKRVLVLGVNGQDGSYVTENLLRRGYCVSGVAKQPTSKYIVSHPDFQYITHDLRDVETLRSILFETKPDLIFHLAAVHGEAGFNYEPLFQDVITVNMMVLHALLEHARKNAPYMRIIYAGSCKIYPAPLTGRINEMSHVAPTCLYGISKVAARELVFHYRNTHGVSATNLVLFNHESPRKGKNYFIPKIANAIGMARQNKDYQVSVRTLSFRCDWSAADELMDLAVDIAELADQDEFVMASGYTWHARDAVAQLLAREGLSIDGCVTESLPVDDIKIPDYYIDLDRLERAIGRRPMKGLFEVVDEIVACMK